MLGLLSCYLMLSDGKAESQRAEMLHTVGFEQPLRLSLSTRECVETEERPSPGSVACCVLNDPG